MSKRNGSKSKGLDPKERKEVVKLVKNMMDANIDDKEVSANFINNVGTTGIVLPIGLMTRGTTQYQHQGVSIKPKHFTVRGVLRGDSTPAIMRVIYGVYKDVNGTLPTVANILEAVNNAGTATNTWNSPYNINKRSDFIIKSDKCITLSGFTGISRLAAGTSTQTADSYAESKFACLDDRVDLVHKIDYSLASNTGTIADIESNLPFILLITNNNTNLPTYDIKTTLRFEDA